MQSTSHARQSTAVVLLKSNPAKIIENKIQNPTAFWLRCLLILILFLDMLAG